MQGRFGGRGTGKPRAAAALPHALARRTGMIPILHSPGLMMPGQLGPISRVLVCSLMIFLTLTCVRAGVLDHSALGGGPPGAW